MLAVPGEGKVVASLFDRLTDYEPRNSREVLLSTGEQERAYKDSVARDLTNLLNCRRSESEIPEEFRCTRESLAAYGVQDFTAPVDAEAIGRAIERAVRLFEPRLTRVQVSVADDGDFKLSFRITAMLRMEFAVEPVVYDAELPKESRQFRVVADR